MPVVFSPKILPFHIKKAPVKDIKIPNINKVLFMVIIFFRIFFQNTTININKAAAKANKIPSIIFMVIIFLLTNYLDPYFHFTKKPPYKKGGSLFIVNLKNYYYFLVLA